jgi:hypothetical protein
MLEKSIACLLFQIRLYTGGWNINISVAQQMEFSSPFLRVQPDVHNELLSVHVEGDMVGQQDFDGRSQDIGNLWDNV